MKYRLLGKSALSVSEICFGCMSLQQENQENDRIIDRAIELGVNYFDTADLYNKGDNESLLGKLLRQKRKQLILATKVGNQWRADGTGWEWNPRKSYILQAADASLRRLKTDYIDLYQLHGGTMQDPIDDTIEAFEILQQRGKIRHYGISSIRPQVIREWLSRSNIVSVMMQYGLLDRRPEESVVQLLETKNISLLARGTLAKGLLAGKQAQEFLNYNQKEVERAAATVASISNPDRTSAQTAIAFVLQQPVVAAAVVGIRTLEQCEEAAGASDRSPLNQEELSVLRETLAANTYQEHR